jgi:hypothetical protein
MDNNQFLMKFPILVALLGWANSEIAIILSFPSKDGKSASARGGANPNLTIL